MSEKSMKAMVLAGGFPQIALINELKRRGYYVILADYYEDPVAKPYADEFYRESTLDVEAITRIAIKEKIDFLITACTDQALHTVAYVSEKLGLPCYIDYQTALKVTNKEYMKKVFVEHDIPTSKHIILNKFDESAISTMNYPLIVKPVDCNSSKGVKKVLDINELRTALDDAIYFSRTNTAVVEEFVLGEELSVDAYVEDGKVHILCVTNSDKIVDNDKFVIFRSNYPAVDLDHIIELIQDSVQKIADAFKLINTPMLVQMIRYGDKINIIEFSARTGGAVKYRIIKKACGFDVISAVVDLTLGLKPHICMLKSESAYISNEFIYCRDGVFDHLENFDVLFEENIISDYFKFRSKGTMVGGAASSGDRVAGFTIQANTKEDMQRLHNIAASRVKVIDEKGNDIMCHNMFTNLY